MELHSLQELSVVATERGAFGSPSIEVANMVLNLKCQTDNRTHHSAVIDLQD